MGGRNKVVGAEILKRTFLIRAGRSLGTAFTIDEEVKRYLISAGHIVAEGTESVDVLHAGRWLRIEIREIGERSKDIDMGVWAPRPAIEQCGRLKGDRSVALGQDVWFLGSQVSGFKMAKSCVFAILNPET